MKMTFTSRRYGILHKKSIVTGTYNHIHRIPKKRRISGDENRVNSFEIPQLLNDNSALKAFRIG